MVCETFSGLDSFVCRLDGRLRIVAAVALSAMIAVSSRTPALCVALAAGVTLVVAARVPARPVLKRLLSLNVLMGLLAVLLPVTTPGEALFRVGPVACSRAGLVLAAAVAVKANAIVLVLTALLSTIEPVALGRAMGRLHVPNKLIHLYFFTVRYVDVLHHEYERLRRAMRVRGFRPGMNRHTFRSFGYLVGMLLVKSFDRSERIVAAMKCRGFQGRFYLAGHFALSRGDAAFAAAAVVLLGVLGWLQWR